MAKAVQRTKNYVFFDDKLVINSAKKGMYKGMSKFGAFVRQTARQSLRYSTSKFQTSRPGSPPLMHVGTPKTRLFFALNTSTESVVIGSERTKVGTVLNALEYGGFSTIYPTKNQKSRVARKFNVGEVGCIRVKNANAPSVREKFVWAKLKTQTQADRATKLYAANHSNPGAGMFDNTKARRVYIRARPYMRPAFRANLNNRKLQSCFHMCMGR